MQSKPARSKTAAISSWPRPADEGRGDVFRGIEGQRHVEPGVGGIQQPVVFLPGAFGIVAQRLHAEAGLRPGPVQLAARGLEQQAVALPETQPVVVGGAAEHMAVPAQAGRLEPLAHRLQIAGTDLHHGPQLFGEQGGDGILAEAGEIDVQPAVAGEGHFAQGHQQPAVGAVVIGQQQAVAVEFLDEGEEGLHGPRVVEVRRVMADLLVDLRQRRTAEAIAALAQVDQQQRAVAPIPPQLRREGAAHVGDRGKGGHDQRQRRGHRPRFAALLPYRLHRQRILAHRDGDTEFRAQLLADRAHGVEQLRILARMAGGRHPVGRQPHLAQLGDGRAGDVGQRLAHRHASRGGAVQQRHRRALAHGHGLAAVALVVGGGDGGIGHRHLPGTDHLVADHGSGHAAVTDGDEKGLVGHRGQAQHPRHGIAQVDAGGLELGLVEGPVMHVAKHLGRLSQQHLQRQIDRVVVEITVTHHQPLVLGGLADHGAGTALALAQGLEFLQALGRDGQHVAFLGLVAPDLHRRHAGLVVGEGTQFEAPAPATVVHQLGQGVGHPAGAHVVDGYDGIVLAHRPAAIYDLLAAPLHFGIAALYRGIVQVLGAGARVHAGGGPAAETDEHGRATEHDQPGANGHSLFLDMVRPDIAQAPCQHDGLVVAADFCTVDTRRGLFIGTEIAAQVGSSEFVVECSATDGPFNHDIEGRYNSARLAIRLFPWLLKAGNIEV